MTIGLFLDTCSFGWLTFDNSCYKYEKTLDLNLDQGMEHCMNEYNGHMAVLNSKEEAEFLGSYQNDLLVILI